VAIYNGSYDVIGTTDHLRGTLVDRRGNFDDRSIYNAFSDDYWSCHFISRVHVDTSGFDK
jgi:hypothetical protein